MGVSRLNAIEMGFLKRDSIKFAKSSGMFREGLGNMPDKELMSLSMIQIYVLPASQKRIEMKQKKEEEEVKLVSNFETYAAPKSRN